MTTTDATAVRAVILARLVTELHLATDSVETDLAQSVADADLRTIYPDPITGEEQSLFIGLLQTVSLRSLAIA